ncbi:MAG TPA: hypothetical protein VGR62_07925, partial [Candidatus Binatia bacterium]|nr:hypothetical protein [Candidatus Binatia bacterium]
LGSDAERLRAEITALSAATEAARSEQARLERDLEAERAQTVVRQQELDAERNQTAARQQELDVERSQTAARQRELEDALAALRTEHDAAVAQIDALVIERDALREAAAAASEAEAAQAALATAQSTIDTLHAELEQVRADVEQLSTAERELRDAQARAAQEALEARARLEQEAAEALARERSALEEQLATLRAERDDTAATLGVAREDAAREREALREELTSLEARLADVTAASAVAAEAAAAADAARTELAALQTTVDELRTEGAQAREDLDRLATAEQALLADRSRLEQALVEAQEAAAQAAVAPAPISADGDLFQPDAAEELDAEAVLTMEPPPEELADVVAETPTAPETPEVAPAQEAPIELACEATPRIVVLDTDASWDDLTCESHQLTRFAPDADTVTRVVALAPQRLVVNLAVAGALEMVYQLRAAGVTGRCWGMIAGVGAPKVLPLSLIDASCRPLDPDAVIATIGGYAGQGTRVVTVGADVDALISLRQALARQGLSVSMAWNAKQAEDLLGMVKPQVAVVDLDLPQRDGYGIVARLAGMTPVPTMLLVQGVEESGPRFAALLVDPSHRERMVDRGKLLTTVATWTEPVRKEKGKVRQLPR